MTWLIAGFGGLGREIAQVMESDPSLAQETVLALGRHPPTTPMPTLNTQWWQADLSDPQTLRKLPAGITRVVYCATPDQRDEANYQKTYLLGLQHLAHALKESGNGDARLLFVSSTAVYGADQDGCIDENSPTEPSRFNGRVLLAAERWLLDHWPQARVLRLSGIYGPQRRFLLEQLQSGAATVPLSDDYWANRIHVHDAARAVIHLLEKNECEGIFIGTDNTPVPIKTLYCDLAQALGVAEPTAGPPSPMMGRKRLSNQKLLSTGFELRWPDCRVGYAAIMANMDPPAQSPRKPLQ